MRSNKIIELPADRGELTEAFEHSGRGLKIYSTVATFELFIEALFNTPQSRPVAVLAAVLALANIRRGFKTLQRRDQIRTKLRELDEMVDLAR